MVPPALEAVDGGGGRAVCVCAEEGCGYTPAVAVERCDCPDAPPRAQGRQQEFQLQSGF